MVIELRREFFLLWIVAVLVIIYAILTRSKAVDDNVIIYNNCPWFSVLFLNFRFQLLTGTICEQSRIRLPRCQRHRPQRLRQTEGLVGHRIQQSSGLDEVRKL